MQVAGLGLQSEGVHAEGVLLYRLGVTVGGYTGRRDSLCRLEVSV